MSTTLRRLAPPVLAIAAAMAASAWSPPARGGLDDYVKKPDPAFAWTLESSSTKDGATIYHLKLISQVWKGITWPHNLSVIEPADVAYPDAVTLYICGGKIGDG